MSHANLEESYITVVRFLVLSKRHMLEIGTEYGLTLMQAMMVLLLDTPRPMRSFSQLFSCDASNITGLVDGLEQKQLAARYEDQRDRRIKMVKLLPKGQRIRTDLIARSTAKDSPLRAKLTSTELKTLVHLLQKITAGETHV